MVITELGIGFGGLCHTINTQFSPKMYHLMDLPEVQELAFKCLSKFGITNISKEKPEMSDLFISEFCFSEFTDEQMGVFYEDYIIKSKNVYLYMNMHDEQRKSAFISKISQDFDIIVEAEYPATHWPNYLIFGKKKDI
jgi:hypothetical protein